MLRFIKKLLGYDVTVGYIYYGPESDCLYLVTFDEQGIFTEVNGATRVRGKEYANHIYENLVFIDEL